MTVLSLAGRLGRRRSSRLVSDPAGCLDAFDTCLIAIDGERVELVAGAESLEAFLAALGLVGADAGALLERLANLNAQIAARLAALRGEGEAFILDAAAADLALRIEGRTSGALAVLRLARQSIADRPNADVFAAFVNELPEPCWIVDASGAPIWVNRAWLEAVGAASLGEAGERGLSLDGEADRAAREAATLGDARTVLRWVRTRDGRRALRFRVQPLRGGGAGVWADDVTEAETAAETLGRAQAAQEAMFERVADAVAVFGPDRRLAFHNPAFAELWDLEPAWLADRPSHGEILDRLRRRGSLPEQADFAAFKTAELARHEALSSSPEVLWRLPNERTLKVGSQPHPGGGLMIVFSDVTPELRLRAQFNHLLQVQQATLDKLTDAVAVFGADGRLRLHNEAFARFWSAAEGQLMAGADFQDVVNLAQPRLHDLQFWRDLRARITDPDPLARAASQTEILTADRRIVAHQSRPLPDGATLIGFADVTDTRQLERALADREAALSEAERLKREFVDSVSYELRTPLTTILGYAELLEQEGHVLEPRARSHLGSIRAAATHLARSINNVLDMAQFDAGDVATDMGDVDVDALLARIVETWSKAADEQGVSLAVAAGEAVGLMRGDAGRLAEVLDHLTENALRHTPRGGSVTLSAERALGEVRLQVSDTGRGIPFHVQAHIFDRFSGQDRAASGLGLALVKALVELHGGWVALESEPGAGATFTCHLPEAAEGSEARPELF
ncbi:MAG: PAS-domain containing protein [Caulobacteraceae bacterium]